MRGERIIKDGFFARHLTKDGKTAKYFYPPSYTGKKFYQTEKSKVTIPEGGSGIYFGLAGDGTWKGDGLFGFFWAPNNGVEIRLTIPNNSGLKIVDLRSPENAEYIRQWARNKQTGLPLCEKYLSCPCQYDS